MKRLQILALGCALVPGIARAWIAYNDLGWAKGQATGKDVTHYRPADARGRPADKGGELKEHGGGGAGVGAYVRFSFHSGKAGAIEARPKRGEPPTGGDAHKYFYAEPGDTWPIDLRGCTQVEDDLAAWLDLTFSNLDSSLTYDFTIYGDRDNASGDNGPSDITLSGSVGSDGTLDGVLFGNSNSTMGNVARFTDIDPGPDGVFTIRIAPDPSGSPAAYVNGFMLESSPEPATVILFGVSALLVFVRRLCGGMSLGRH